jgi:hypothetical protein
VKDNRIMGLPYVSMGRRGLVWAVLVTLTLAAVGPTNARGTATITGSDAAASGRAAEPLPNAGPTLQPNELAPITPIEMQSYGCLAAGAVTLGLAALVDRSELILVFGATVVPTTPVGTVLAVGGVIFASTCAVGALAAPAVVRMWQYYHLGRRPAS